MMDLESETQNQVQLATVAVAVSQRELRDLGDVYQCMQRLDFKNP